MRLGGLEGEGAWGTLRMPVAVEGAGSVLRPPQTPTCSVSSPFLPIGQIVWNLLEHHF